MEPSNTSKEIGCPVSLSCGEHTGAFPARFLRVDAEQLPRATVEVLPGIGHFGPLQRPDLVAGSVDRSFTATGTPRS
jgi:pimeloyl-ACP methyl ester carboxylesterase